MRSGLSVPTRSASIVRCPLFSHAFPGTIPNQEVKERERERDERQRRVIDREEGPTDRRKSRCPTHSRCCRGSDGRGSRGDLADGVRWGSGRPRGRRRMAGGRPADEPRRAARETGPGAAGAASGLSEEAVVDGVSAGSAADGRCPQADGNGEDAAAAVDLDEDDGDDAVSRGGPGQPTEPATISIRWSAMAYVRSSGNDVMDGVVTLVEINNADREREKSTDGPKKQKHKRIM